MKQRRWTERMKVPLFGASNWEDVKVTWLSTTLDDGYVVTELLEFEIITHSELQ